MVFLVLCVQFGILCDMSYSIIVHLYFVHMPMCTKYVKLLFMSLSSTLLSSSLFVDHFMIVLFDFMCFGLLLCIVFL